MAPCGSVYVVGLAGLSGVSKEKLKVALEEAGVSVRIISESEIDFMISRRLIDQSLIGVLADPLKANALLEMKRESDFDIFIVAYEDNEGDCIARVLSELTSSLTKRNISLSEQCTRTLFELSEVRQLLDRTQRSQVEIERYLYRHTLLKPQTLFSTSPGAGKVELKPGQRDMLQPLPHDPFGLCSVAIRLASPIAVGSGLEVDLSLGSDLSHRWTVRGPLPKGPLLLSLPIALDEQYRTPSLAFRALTNSGGPIELALAEQRMTPKWSATLGERDLEFPLALALDFAPAGTKIPARGGIVADQDIASAKKPEVVLLSSWPSIQYHAEEIRHDWQLVIAEDGMLQAHPLVNFMNVVHLDGVNLTGVRRLKVDICLAHEQAPRVGFAIALIARDNPKRISLKDTGLGWAAKRSSWFELSGKSQGRAVFEWEASDEKDMTLALVTTCLDKRANFAWARWGAIILES